MAGKWMAAAVAAAAALTLAAPAQGATATFDFEEFPGSSQPICSNGAPALPMSRGDLTATVTREGDGLVAVQNASTGWPADWGSRSLCTAGFENSPGGAFIVTFSRPVSAVSIGAGDYGQDADTATLEGYSGAGGTGTLLASDSEALAAGGFDFRVAVLSNDAQGIRSIRFFGTATPFDNSLYWDNIAVTYEDDPCATDPAPAGCWHFDEEAGSTTAVDSSGNDNHGVYVNGPLLGVPGVFNTAVSMDGKDDHVRVPDDPTLDTGDSFSLVGWVKRDEDGRTHQLFNKGGKGYHLVVMSRFEGNQVWLRKANSSTIVRSNGGVPADGRYHQVVATKDGPGSAQLYIDGVPQDEQVVSGAQVIENTSFPLYFSATPSGNVVAGDLDEYAVYDEALTAEQVAANHEGESPAPETARTTATQTTTTSSSRRSATRALGTAAGCGTAGTATSGITGLKVAGLPCTVATAAAYKGLAALEALGVSCRVTSEDFTGTVTRIGHACTGPLGLRLTYTSLS